MVARLTASKAGKLNFNVSMPTNTNYSKTGETTTVKGDTLTVKGALGNNGLLYNSQIKVVLDNGEGTLSEGADGVLPHRRNRRRSEHPRRQGRAGRRQQGLHRRQESAHRRSFRHLRPREDRFGPVRPQLRRRRRHRRAAQGVPEGLRNHRAEARAGNAGVQVRPLPDHRLLP